MWKTDKRGHLANFNGEKWRFVLLFRLLFEGLDGFSYFDFLYFRRIYASPPRNVRTMAVSRSCAGDRGAQGTKAPKT